MSPRPSIPVLAPLARVRGELLALAGPVAPVRVAAVEAIGAVAAEDLVVGPWPGRATAMRAGFAVAAIETVGASPYAPATPSRLIAVAAGAPLPEGCDAVVPGEAVVEDFGVAALQQAVAPGENVRRVGEDLAAASRPIVAGHRIGAAAAAIAATIGCGDPAIRRPRLAIVATGDAAAGAGARLEAVLAGLAVEIVVADVEAAAAADLHLLVGGPEIGGDDPALAALDRLGSRAGHGAALTGLESAAWGAIDGRPALVLPDRPEAAVIARLALIEPLVAALAGGPAVAAPIVGRLTRKLVSQVGMSEIALFAREPDAWRPLAVGTLPWSALLAADAHAELPPESEGAAEGTSFAARPLTSPRSLP